MKRGSILLIVGVLLMGIAIFFGYYSYSNEGAADRLNIKLGPEAGFLVESVREKADRQMTYSLLAGIPGLLAVIGGVVMRRKA